jgi:hypothetical protein
MTWGEGRRTKPRIPARTPSCARAGRLRYVVFGPVLDCGRCLNRQRSRYRFPQGRGWVRHLRVCLPCVRRNV